MRTLSTKEIERRISSLDFVADFFVGHGRSGDGRQVSGRRIWCDSPLTALVRHKGEAIAVIGFRIFGRTLYVEQLQGIAGVNVRTSDLGCFLISKAEQMARTLGLVMVCVQPASRNLYWELHDEHRLYPRLYEHQDRLRQRYDRSARHLGYDPPVHGYPWWHKIIRKRLTWPRWYQLQLILFDRAARRQWQQAYQFSTD